MYGTPAKHASLKSVSVDEHLARHKRILSTNRRALQQQRHDQIAESIRVRQRNHRQLDVAGADSHRFDDPFAVGDQVRLRGQNRFGKAGRSGCELQQRGVRVRCR